MKVGKKLSGKNCVLLIIQQQQYFFWPDGRNFKIAIKRVNLTISWGRKIEKKIKHFPPCSRIYLTYK